VHPDQRPDRRPDQYLDVRLDRASPSHGLRILRRHYSCKLRFGELLIDCRYVLDPATGRPVMPVPAQVLCENRSPSDDPDAEVVIFVPDDSTSEAAEALQILALPEPIEPRAHEAGDRYLVYHGAANERCWAALSVQSVRWHGAVVSGEEMLTPNPLRGVEPRVCKALNADPGRIGVACQRATGTLPMTPLVVGVDPDGIDVRARFGVIRIEFGTAALLVTDLSARLEALGLRWTP